MSENILLVTIDSLRADYVHSNCATTQNHRKLAKTSTIYQSAFSQGPFTTFSMPSLFTSKYPSGLNYTEFSESTIGVYIDEEPTLATVLRDAGYDTAGFHSNPLLSSLFGFDRGFNTFDARLPFSDTDVLPGRAKILADKAFRLIRKHPYLPADKVNERAIEWLDERTYERPFFLWVHYMDVHGPYIAKDGFHYWNKYRGERLWRKAVTRPDDVTKEERDCLRELYREEVEYTDIQLGNLFDSLRKRDLWDETVVAVTSDHGEGFGEHGTFSHPHSLYDELTHIPLFVRDPDGPSGEIEMPVELLDLAPTLVARAEGTMPDSFIGTPLPSTDGENESDATAISEADIVPEYNGSIRTERYRYIRNDVDGREELYDVHKDPEQHRNLADERVDIRDELATKLNEHLAHSGREAGEKQEVTQTNIEDGEVQDRLEDLGYLK